MKTPAPEIGTTLIVARHAQPPERTRVVNRIGQYLFLENGLRFHVRDDQVGPGKWHLPHEHAAVSVP